MVARSFSASSLMAAIEAPGWMMMTSKLIAARLDLSRKYASCLMSPFRKREAERGAHDPPETDRPIAMDDVDRSLRELPEMARSLAEGSGHHINGIFFNEPVQAFLSCPKR